MDSVTTYRPEEMWPSRFGMLGPDVPTFEQMLEAHGAHVIELPEPPPPKIIGYRYLFSDAPLGPVMIVATAGSYNDWAAYAAAVPFGTASDDDVWHAQVARTGCKLTERQAEGFFPFTGTGMRYRP